MSCFSDLSSSTNLAHSNDDFLSRRIHLQDLHDRYSFEEIKSYLRRHGETGFYSDHEMDEFLKKAAEEGAREESKSEEPMFTTEEMRGLLLRAETVFPQMQFAESLATAMANVPLSGSIKRCVCVGLAAPSVQFLAWEIPDVPNSRSDLCFLTEKNFSREAKVELFRLRLLEDGNILNAIALLQLAAFKWIVQYGKLPAFENVVMPIYSATSLSLNLGCVSC